MKELTKRFINNKTIRRFCVEILSMYNIGRVNTLA